MKPIKLSTLKAKPTLVEKLCQSPAVLEAFGAPIQFWTWDRIPMETYMQLVDADPDDIKIRFEIAKSLILDEDGSTMLQGTEVFTPAVMTEVVSEVFSDMGNLSAGNLTGTTPQ